MLSVKDQKREQELAGLEKAMKRFFLQKGIIISRDQEETIKNISIIPACKWLLENT